MDSDGNSFTTTAKLVNYLDPRYRQQAVEEGGLLIIIVQCIQTLYFVQEIVYLTVTGSFMTNLKNIYMV